MGKGSEQPGKEMAPGCIMGRRQAGGAGGGSVMVFPCICALFQQDVSCHTVKIGLKQGRAVRGGR